MSFNYGNYGQQSSIIRYKTLKPNNEEDTTNGYQKADNDSSSDFKPLNNGNSSSTRYKTLKPNDGENINNGYQKADNNIPADAKPLENSLVRSEPIYDMQGIKPFRGTLTDAKPLQRDFFDPNFSTPEDTYIKKSEMGELFTQEEIEKYFDYKYVHKSNGDRHDMFLAFAIKSGLEINGVKITTIDELLQALGKDEKQ